MKKVFKNKKDDLYRKHLVELVYNKTPGVDFTENYSQVVYKVILSFFLPMLLINKWYYQTIYFKTKF